MEGEIVRLEDLVLHDANTAPALPSQNLFRARGVLLSWRSLAPQDPSEILSLTGLSTLEERRNRLVEPDVPESLLNYDPEWDSQTRIT